MLVKRHSNHLPTLVSDFWGEDMFPQFEQQNWNLTPAVNIVEDDHLFKVEVAAPGLGKENFKVHVEKNILEISSEKKEEEETKNGKYLRREFSYSEFRRTFSLPSYVDPEKINATHKDGVLTVEIPKKDEAKVNPRKQIEIS
jgi:HSP20 family protein